MSVFQVSRLGISVNLPAGATNDILLVNTPAFPVGAVTFEFSKPTSAKITGIQKCAQFFLKVLLTTKGSDLLNPSYGTELPALLVGSNVNLNSKELMASVSTAVADAVNQSRILLNDSTNDMASMLSSVTITDIAAPASDSFSISLKLVTMAGETGSLSLPSPLMNTQLFKE